MTLEEAIPIVVWTVDNSGHVYNIVDTPGHGVDWFYHWDEPRESKGVILATVWPDGEEG